LLSSALFSLMRWTGLEQPRDEAARVGEMLYGAVPAPRGYFVSRHGRIAADDSGEYNRHAVATSDWPSDCCGLEATAIEVGVKLERGEYVVE
jgi:hypothetical protein